MLEMLAVVVIIGLIALVVVRRIVLSRGMCQENACFQNRAAINGAVEYYYLMNGTWPSDLSDIGALPSFPDGLPDCPVSGAAYAIDETTHRVAGHTPGNH